MLFGFLEIQMWNYWWGMSESQIDLLLIDQPLIVYKRDKKGKKGAGSKDMTAPDSWKVEEATRKWQQKYGNGNKPKLKLNLSGDNQTLTVTTD